MELVTEQNLHFLLDSAASDYRDNDDARASQYCKLRAEGAANASTEAGKASICAVARES